MMSLRGTSRVWPPAVNSVWRFRETVFWENRDGFGSTTSLDFDRVLHRDLLLRWGNVGTISESTEGFSWRSTALVYHNLRRSRAVAGEAARVRRPRGLPPADRQTLPVRRPDPRLHLAALRARRAAGRLGDVRPGCRAAVRPQAVLTRRPRGACSRAWELPADLPGGLPHFPLSRPILLVV